MIGINSSHAAITTAFMDYTASSDLDGGVDALWEDAAGNGHDFELANVTYNGSPTGAPSGVTAIYSFNGTNSAALWGAGKNAENIVGGNPTGLSATFEVLFRADGSHQEKLWELGGSGAGISMTLNNGNLQFYDSKNSSNGGVTGSYAVGEFVHAVGTLDMTNNLMVLYINGTQVGSTTYSATDWAGTDGGTDGALGWSSGSTTGGQAVDSAIHSYGWFDGDIAAFRFYKGEVADQTDVDVLFAATGIPEPSTIALLLLSGFGLLWRKR
ncbi:MAG: LamG-like jellyroll fold domain-containing protein [Luteolibacter sp.]